MASIPEQRTSAPAEPEAPPSGIAQQMPVVTDSNFVRAFADRTLVMPLGRDVDLAFMAFASRIDNIEGLDDEGRTEVQVNLTPQLNELARVRLAPRVAVGLALDVMQHFIRLGGVNLEGVIETLREADSGRASNKAEEGA